MKKIERIIIEAEPSDIVSALIEKNNIPSDFEVVEFTYTMKKIDHKSEIGRHMLGVEDYKITYCKIILERKVNV